MQFAKTLLCTTALLLVPALRAQQGDTPKPAAEQPKADADQAKPKQGPAEEMEMRRHAAKRMAGDVRYNRRAMVIMKRLTEVYGQKNDAGKLEEVRGLAKTQTERNDKNMKMYREKLGAETYAAVEAAMEVKTTPAERKAARERLRDLLGGDAAVAGNGRRAPVQGKPVTPKTGDDADGKDDDLDAPDDSAGAAAKITAENADATLEKLKKELAKGQGDKPKDEKPKDAKPKDAPKAKD